MKSTKRIMAWTSIVAALVLASLAWAGVPQTINYQGYLKNTDGTPVSLPVNVGFSLYTTSTLGTPKWSVTKNINPDNGVYSVQLGSDDHPLPPTLFNNDKLWLGVTVGADQEMTPRQQLTTTPYAFRSGTADSAATATNAVTIGGQSLANLDSRYIDPTQPHTTPQQIATLRWDTVTGNSDGAYPVGSHPRGMAFDGASIWVANSGSNNVTRLNPATGATIGTYGVGTVPTGVAFDGTNIWVINCGADSLSKINPASGTINTYTLGSNSGAYCGIIFDGTDIWTTDGGYISKINPTDGSILLHIDYYGAEGISFDGTNIWVSTVLPKEVYKVNPSTGTVVASYSVGTKSPPVPGSPFDFDVGPTGIAFDGTSIWVVNRGESYVSKFDPATGTGDSISVGTSGPPLSPYEAIASDGTNIWVTDYLGNMVEKLGTNLNYMGSFAVGSGPSGIVFDGANIWVSNYNDNTVTKLANVVVPLGAQSVGTTQLAGGSVTSNQIAAYAVTNAQIADGAVTAPKLADNAVTTGKLASNAVTASQIASNAVTTAKIADGAVTDAKITGPISLSKFSIPIYPFNGAVGNIANGATAYIFAGPTVTLTTLANQRISGAIQAPLGTTSASAVVFDYGLCYRQHGASTLYNFVGSQTYSTGTSINTAGRQSFAAIATIVPGAGSWDIGFCLRNHGVAALDNNDLLSGWIMLTY